MEKIRVHIISGFLGAGKTTAISRLLRSKNTSEQWAVIVNEFGKISIDSQTIVSNTSSGTVFEISGGCICCSARANFQENLLKIVNTGIFNRIIIEPSGLGGIEMVSEILNSMSGLRMMPVICMVDIISIENPRLQLNQIYKAQIINAEFIVFSKCDVPANSIILKSYIEKFKSLFPEKAGSLTIADENIWPSLLDMHSEANIYNEKNNPPFHNDSGLMAGNYFEHSLVYHPEIIFNKSKFTEIFSGCTQIVRAKGFIRTEAGWCLFNSTFSACTFEPCSDKEQSNIIMISSEYGIFKSLKTQIENSL